MLYSFHDTFGTMPLYEHAGHEFLLFMVPLLFYFFLFPLMAGFWRGEWY